ncbi:hypothetical protein Q1695_004223 [Nippostrongylus brasiliensis]|nr:hypothetical protein Q1695_004223 [Nippostrongylus brasiliensis]
MLLTVISLAFLIVPCAPQTGNIGVVTGISPPKQCVSSNVAPQQPVVRLALYHSVNHLRRQFALGEDVFPQILHLKGPRLMYAVRYSCDLEKKAFLALITSKRPDGYASLMYDSEPGEKRNLTSYLLEAATQWKGEHSLGPSVLMYAYVLFMGCAYNYKAEGELARFHLLCLFDKRAVDVPKTETLTPPCKQNSDCKWFSDSTCQDSLCWGPQESYNIQ